jgi:hypothetical protein
VHAVVGIAQHPHHSKPPLQTFSSQEGVGVGGLGVFVGVGVLVGVGVFVGVGVEVGVGVGYLAIRGR